MKRTQSLLASIIVLVILSFLGTSSASAASTGPHAMAKAMSPLTVAVKDHSTQAKEKVNPLSETYNCDVNPTYGDFGYILCSVEADATPCLRLHSGTDFSQILGCITPGTIVSIECQAINRADIANGNIWWDRVHIGNIANGYGGWVADGYMDTEWTNNAGSPTIPTCSSGL